MKIPRSIPNKVLRSEGIIGDLGVMKITLKHDAKLVKQRPYQLNLKYKEKVHQELDAEIIEPVEESN